MHFHQCPRCGFNSYEQLKTHSYCYECNYCPDLDCTREVQKENQVPQWAINFIKGIDVEEQKEVIQRGAA